MVFYRWNSNRDSCIRGLIGVFCVLFSLLGSADAALIATLEGPEDGQTVAGVAVIRGWAFSSTGRTINKVQLLVDGNLFAAVPCCSPRGDVAAGFPGSPQALNSGFGITVNYGELTTGVHTLAIKIEDSAGATKTLYKGVLAKQQDGTFVNQIDMSAATMRIANGAVVIEGAKVSPTNSQQPSLLFLVDEMTQSDQ